jgi:SAM-dependent methyltransferase
VTPIGTPQETSYRYTVDRDGGGGLTIEMDTAQGVFIPTQTSRLLIQGARQLIQRPGKLLDLGCGIGACGLVLAKLGLCHSPVYLSDSSGRAAAVASENAKKLKLPAVIRQGSLLDPWQGERFDVIVDDVSGISEEVAKLSNWFPEGVDCKTGRDGTALTLRVLEEAPGHLNPGGALLFPVLSLSNENRILEAASLHFSEVSLVVEQTWLLPGELLKHFDKLQSLREEGALRLDQKFGIWLWSTRIYKALFPRVEKPPRSSNRET